MSSQNSTSRPARSRKLIGGLMIAASLAACNEQGEFAMPSFGDGATANVPEASSGPTVERDVEAPEVFSVTDDGLWDGRPSLGGVWVAYPDVEDPERVIIRNQTNDKFVVGALFRRERDIPGPSLQISSDAAAELGILAGAPTNLNVTALRKEQASPEPAAAAAPAEDAIPDAAAVETTPLDPVTETASAAIDAAAPPAAEAPAPPPPQTSRLDKPFIQIGIFSVEANADRAANQMRSAGLAPTVKRSQINGKTFWRVVVGPAANATERGEILSTIKGEGFTDAYAVSS